MFMGCRLFLNGSDKVSCMSVQAITCLTGKAGPEIWQPMRGIPVTLTSQLLKTRMSALMIMMRKHMASQVMRLQQLHNP